MALVLLGTIVGVGGFALAAIFLFVTGARQRAMQAAVAAVGWAALYAGGLVAVSLASRETVLPLGATKTFCGFYLDCHLGVAVLGDSTAHDIAEHHAHGIFHIVTLRFSNSARRATLTPHDLRLELVDARGTRYAEDRGARANLDPPRTIGPIGQPIPAGGVIEDQAVFDIPVGVGPLRLLAREGPAADRTIELVLLGDEDSFLHRKTLLAVTND